jgi:integrase
VKDTSNRGYTCLGNGLYRDNRTGNFYERPFIDGRRTFRKIQARNIKLAREALAARRTDQARSEQGLCRSPYTPAPQTVAALAELWKNAGCPNRHGHPKYGTQLVQEQSRLSKLLPHFKTIHAHALKPRHCLEYWSKRRGEMPEGKHGGRAVDLELATLSTILHWAVIHGYLESNPLASGRPKFRGKTVRHCRDCMPVDANELHALAAHLFSERRSEVLGWQLLLEAMTGCRTIEVLRLRWDATGHRAGHIEGDWLWLDRAKGGVTPYVQIHPALRQLLDALRAWHERRRPKSPWFLPGLRNGGKDPVESCSLTHALKVIGPLIAKGHRTSHGLRAYYVTARRSQGIADAVIAAEIGDRTGASIIATTYGEVPPNWTGGKQLGWLPDGEPAWTRINYGMQEGMQPKTCAEKI